MTPRRPSEKGMSLLGAIVAVLVLAAMGTAMMILVATNQEMRAHQYTFDQSFSSAQAGLEVVLGMIHSGTAACGSLNRNLSESSLVGDSVTVSRTGGRIYITAVKGDSSTSISIVDPDPPNAGDTILIDTGDAKDSSNGAPPRKLIDVHLQLNAGCGSAVTLTTMVVTWTPDLDEGIQQIKLDGGNIYSGAARESGEGINVTDTTISDAGVHTIDFVRWNGDIQNRLYTLRFNFSDGSSKTATVDTR